MIFTAEQHTIFDFVQEGKGHGIIDAVAGAGKTTTIMECARFVPDNQATLFCAFNTSIAKEIAKKFHQKGIHEITVKTIHALGRQILVDNNATGYPIKLDNRKYPELLNSGLLQNQLKPYFERLARLNGLRPEAVDYDKRQQFAVRGLYFKIRKRLVDINQKYRSTLTKGTLEDFEKMVIHFSIFNRLDVEKKGFRHELKLYYDCHKLLLKAGNELSKNTMVIDFTDMLYLPYRWKLAPAQPYDFLFIDECQDLSKAQFAVAAKYGKQDGRILAVGDPQQSIYGFTGADINSFERVKIYTKAKMLPLTTCFRCPQSIIEIAQDIRKDIKGNKKQAGEIHTIPIHQVNKLAKPGDLIISRLRSGLVLLVFDFIDKNIKVQIHEDEATEFIGELKNIFKQEELQRRLTATPNDFEKLRMVVFKRWEWMIKKDTERIVDPTERAIRIKQELDFLNQKLDFIHKKVELWKANCPTLTHILKKIKTFVSDKDNPIRLSTIHRAQGLEENRVFIIDYDKMPYDRPGFQQWEKTQEIHLKYVAVTRAKEVLFLVEAMKIEELKQERSLFDDMPF